MADKNHAPVRWDVSLAADLLGKRLLVGLTYVGVGGTPVDHLQVHGRVQTADPHSGVILQLEGKRAGESFTLPPDTSAIRIAPPGDYHLRSTGETVANPDYLAEWTINDPS